MKAKIVLNEIRKAGREYSLSSLNVGKAVELRAFNWFNENLPHVIRDAQPMDVALADEKYGDLIRIIKKRISINVMNHKWIDNTRDLYNWTMTRMVSNFANNIPDMKVFFSINASSKFVGIGARGTRCEYSETYGIGSIEIARHDTIGNLKGWFVQYR